MRIGAESALLAPASPASAAPERIENVEQAAAQFESLLIEQMLKTARQAGSGGGGWFGTGEDQAGESMMEMAEQQFARAIASRGGLGIAALVIRGLKTAEATPPKRTP